MALDDLVKYVGSESQLTQQLRENTSYNQYISTLGATETLGEETSNIKVLEQNPAIQEALIASDTVHALQEKIYGEVKDNKDEIIESLDEMSLINLAMQYSEDAKGIRKDSQMLQEKNTEYFLANLMKNSSTYMTQVLSRLNPTQILQLAQRDVQSKQQGFMNKYLQKEVKDDDGKTTGYKLDKEKAIEYVGKVIGDNPESYIQLGKMYTLSKSK